MTNLAHEMVIERQTDEAKTGLDLLIDALNHAQEQGNFDLAENICEAVLDRLQRLRGCMIPTTVMGICPDEDFTRAMGELGFFELVRFEKEHFMVLLNVLEIPDTVCIKR